MKNFTNKCGKFFNKITIRGPAVSFAVAYGVKHFVKSNLLKYYYSNRDNLYLWSQAGIPDPGYKILSDEAKQNIRLTTSNSEWKGCWTAGIMLQRALWDRYGASNRQLRTQELLNAISSCRQYGTITCLWRPRPPWILMEVGTIWLISISTAHKDVLYLHK